jgi:hypothetical protein
MATAGWAADVDDVRAPAIGRAAQPEVRTASAAVGERARRAAAAPSPRSGLAGVTVAGGRRPVAQAVGQGTGGLVERGHEAAAVLPPTIPAILPATAAVPHPAVPNPEPVATEAEGPLLLATGVFIGGTAGLIVGARYAIVRAGTDFRVLGPLDSAPDAVAVHRPLDELDPLAVDDRCVIAQRSDPGRALIAMRGIAGLTGEGLEAGLRPGVPPGEAAS